MVDYKIPRCWTTLEWYYCIGGDSTCATMLVSLYKYCFTKISDYPTSDCIFPCFSLIISRFMTQCILMQLGPIEEDVRKPVNPLVFLRRFILGVLASAYYVLVPIYMWIKDQVVPKGQPIWEGISWLLHLIAMLYPYEYIFFPHL